MIHDPRSDATMSTKSPHDPAQITADNVGVILVLLSCSRIPRGVGDVTWAQSDISRGGRIPAVPIDGG
jgi:hypothetical protein